MTKPAFPQIDRSMANFNNHAIAMNYQSPTLARRGIGEIKAVAQLDTDADFPRYVMKFKMGPSFGGYALFDMALFDEILEYSISNDFDVLSNIMKKVILEEIKNRIISKCGLDNFELSYQVISYESFIKKAGNGLGLLKMVGVSVTFNKRKLWVYLLLKQRDYLALYKELLSIETVPVHNINRSEITECIDVVCGPIPLTEAEYQSLTVGSILFVDFQDELGYLKVLTTKGKYRTTVKKFPDVEIKGVYTMSENGSDQSSPMVEISIALGKKRYSLNEIEKFGVGYVIDSGLSVESLYPLYVNDKPLGQCRLVDIEGSLGYEIVSLESEKPGQNVK